MVKVSKDQMSLLENNLRRARGKLTIEEMKAPVPARRRRKEDLPENILEKQITDYLAYRSFITTRQQVGTFVPYRVLKQIHQGKLTLKDAERNIVRIGEEGASDWWSVRPAIPPGSRPLEGPHLWQGFFWEAKAPGKRPTDEQLVWMDRRRQVGIEAAWFNAFQLGPDEYRPDRPQASHVFEVWFSDYFQRPFAWVWKNFEPGGTKRG
jgi:hypothetical protein